MTDARHELWKKLSASYNVNLTQIQLEYLIEDVKACLLEETFIDSIAAMQNTPLYSKCTCGEKGVELCPISCNNR